MAVAASAIRVKAKSQWRRPPLVWTAILVLFILLAAFGPYIVPPGTQEYHLEDDTLAPFSYGEDGGFHLLGTEEMGRDMLGLIILGARVSFLVAFTALLVAVPFGISYGMLAGYSGGQVDNIMMRVVDGWMAVPPIFIAFVLATMSDPSFGNVLLIMTVAFWTRFARLVRGETVSVRAREYVDLARVAGCSTFTIIRRHILPNVFNSALVLATLYAGSIILFEATLGYLGLSIQPPDISWGLLTAEGRDSLSSAWWISTFGGLAIMIVVLSINQLGDYLRDELDPKLRTV